MNADIHARIMEDSYNGSLFDESIAQLYIDDINYWDQACEIYGPDNGNGRIYYTVMQEFLEYLNFHNMFEEYGYSKDILEYY